MDNKTASQREALGETLVELGSSNNQMVVVGADTTESIRMLDFGKKFPNRFFNVGIAEQNMIGISAGLALAGKTVFTGTYFVFMERAIDQIRNTIAYCNLDVKLIGSHCGISVGPDGGSHQTIEDIAIMQAIPNMRVLAPSDAYSTKKLIKEAAATKGPVYIRILRNSTQVLYTANEDIKLGKFQRLLEGNDITIVSNGILISEALKAADELGKKGISAEVIDCHTVKPMDREGLLEAAKKTGRILTVEDHNIIGGIGSAVAGILATEYPTKMAMIGVRDRFGESGEAPELLKKYGLSSEYIIKEAEELVKR